MGIKLRLALDQTDFFVQSLHETAALLPSASASSPTLASSDPPSPPPSLSLINSFSEPLTAPPPLMHSSTSSNRRGQKASRRPTLIVQRAPLLSVSSGCCRGADADADGLDNGLESSVNAVDSDSATNQCANVATAGLCACVLSYVPVLFPVLSLLMISLELTARFVPDRFGHGNGVFEMFDNVFHAAAAVLVVVCALRFDRFILARLMRSFTTYFQLFNCMLYALFSFWQWQQFAQQQADTAAIANAAIFYATTILSFVALMLVDAWPPMSHRLKVTTRYLPIKVALFVVVDSCTRKKVLWLCCTGDF